MSWALGRTIEPTETPVTLPEAKHHLRVDDDAEDSLIEGLNQAATNWVEEYTGRQLVDATWLLTLERFPRFDELLLPRPPVNAITSITYHTSDGNALVMPAGDYVLDNSNDYGPHRLYLAQDADWPAEALRRVAGVEILYTAGYGGAEDVPDQFKSGIKMVAGSLYENRETEVVGTIASILRHSTEWVLFPYRVWL
jgi:uncharacterized phiE125 gp8 family phage protein